jgi:flagellar biosynthesis/type III secretory pathway protein FliH
MPLDQELRRQFEALTDRLRAEVTQQLALATEELAAFTDAERAAAVQQAATDARAEAEREAVERLAAAVSQAEDRGRSEGLEAGHQSGLAQGRIEGHSEGLAQGRVEGVAQGVAEGLAQGRAEGLAEGRVEGRLEGLVDGRVEGVAEGLAQGRAEGLAEGRAEGLAEGRIEGRAEGLAEGRAEGLVEGRVEGAAEGLARGLAEGLAEGRVEGRAEGLAEGRAEGRAEGLAEGRTEGLAEGRAKGLSDGRLEARGDADAERRILEMAAGDRLVEAVRSIDGARSLSEVLDALASRAGREAARVGVLLVRGGTLRGWRFIGFDGALDDAASAELPVEQSGILADAIRTCEPVSANSSQRAAVPSFASLPPGREMLALPIPINGQVVAVLYADQGGHDAGHPGRAEPVVWPTRLEVLARLATRCLEIITAFRAAQILKSRGEPPVVPCAPGNSTGRTSAPGGATSETAASDDDEAARRYARLLISDIKLYHEREVIAGRRDRDVAIRLGGEIARARVLYEQRVPAHIRGATDHFHAELVRTLADGDPTLLGQTT